MPNPPRTDRDNAEPLRILYLVLGRVECTIVDDAGNRVSIDDAKRLWEACRVEDYNLAFRRLVSMNWDYEAVKAFYANGGRA